MVPQAEAPRAHRTPVRRLPAREVGTVDDIVDLVSRSDEELRGLIAEFEAEEREISRQRRILHAKIDILRAELVMRLQQTREEGTSLISANDLERLTQILAGRGPGAREAGRSDALSTAQKADDDAATPAARQDENGEEA